MLDYLSIMTIALSRQLSGRKGLALRSVATWHPLSGLVLAALIGCGSSTSPEADAPVELRPRPNNDPNPNAPISRVDGAGEGPDSATPQGSSPVSEPLGPGVYAGTYFVPVAVELEPYARFEIESLRLEARDGELVLRYDLPELLLGEVRGVSFRGSATAAPDGTYALSGADGTATCRGDAGGWSCDEVLDGIEVDADKINRLLEAMSDVEAVGRRSVADQFSIDPIGVLHISPNY